LVRFQAGTNVHIGAGLHTVSYLFDAECFPWEKVGGIMKPTTRFHPVPMSRMRGAVPLLPYIINGVMLFPALGQLKRVPEILYYLQKFRHNLHS
jgi:hypothetical protein